jgi:hypothetical protein
MKCVILQPSYIPWRSYFHQIQKADLCIFDDDATFDKDGWRNRNRIKTSTGTKWLTIPVTAGAGRQLHTTPIHQVRVCEDQLWQATHWKTLQHAYARAPYFKRYAEILDPFYHSHTSLLGEFVVRLTLVLAEQLGIRHAQFRKSSDLDPVGSKTDRLVSMLKSVGATHYISGLSAREYLDESKLWKAGVTLEYLEDGYPEYEQLHPPFDPNVSVVDLLFMKGPAAHEYIWG